MLHKLNWFHLLFLIFTFIVGCLIYLYNKNKSISEKFIQFSLLLLILGISINPIYKTDGSIFSMMIEIYIDLVIIIITICIGYYLTKLFNNMINFITPKTNPKEEELDENLLNGNDAESIFIDDQEEEESL